jgi:hypothetical protein
MDQWPMYDVNPVAGGVIWLECKEPQLRASSGSIDSSIDEIK